MRLNLGFNGYYYTSPDLNPGVEVLKQGQSEDVRLFMFVNTEHQRSEVVMLIV